MKQTPNELKAIRAQLAKLSTKERAKASAWFFKMGPGDYAEGDQFMGITVPEVRTVAKSFKELSLDDTLLLLRSPFHEERLLALFLLVQRFKKSDEDMRTHIYEQYLAHTTFVNNWDLVDGSAASIVGEYLGMQPHTIIRKTLIALADSDVLWERRIAIVATFYWIKKGESAYTFLVAKHLLADRHDLIQKAIGWMLREVGKKCSEETLRTFLDTHLPDMGRTTLRYAIERFPESLRKEYLARR